MMTVDEKFIQYFAPHELVSKLHYDEFENKQDIYNLFKPELKAVIVYLREAIKKSFTVNNWGYGGQFQYRGYRDRTCSVGAPKSAHRTGEALDFDIRGFEAEKSRELIELAIKNLPHPIRIEKDVNWVHIDIRNVDNSHKINYFRP